MGRYFLGVNNAWAVKRFVEPSSWAEILAGMDIDTVQFTFDLLDPSVDRSAASAVISETSSACKKYGISLHSCFTGLASYSYNLLTHPNPGMRKWAFRWYIRALEMTSELKVKAAGGHFGSISSKDNGDPLRRERLISQLVRRIDLLRGRAGRLGLDTLLWEPMPTFREPPSSVKETRDLLSAANRDGGKATVKLCIDVGHACNPELSSTRDADPCYWLEELAKDSPCVHIQQTDGTSDRHWPFTPKFNRLGIVKPEKIIASLDKSGAEEVGLFLEIVPPFEQPDGDVLRDLKQSVRYWKEYL